MTIYATLPQSLPAYAAPEPAAPDPLASIGGQVADQLSYLRAQVERLDSISSSLEARLGPIMVDSAPDLKGSAVHADPPKPVLCQIADITHDLAFRIQCLNDRIETVLKRVALL